MFRLTPRPVALALAALLVLPALGCEDAGKDGDTASYDDVGMTALEQAVHDAVNDYRASVGLDPLAPDATILAEARGHSEDMMSGAVPFSHDGFETRVAAIGEVIAVQSAGENVAHLIGMPDPVTTAVQGWVESDGHRENLEGNFNLTGLGAAESGNEIYLTQIFALSF